jgi:glycosyltransferase involved in cell wall biosynthesis
MQAMLSNGAQSDSMPQARDSRGAPTVTAPTHAGPAPTVSVVMTVYNTADYVAEAVESILKQTFADFELVIVDDGSTDGSTAILRELAARDARIRLVSRPNTGIVRAANEGLAMATGRYVARMDSDDISDPTRLAKQVEYMEAHPDCVLLGSRVIVCDPYGSAVYRSGHKLAHEEIDAQLMSRHGGWAVVQPSSMLRTNAVRRVGGYRGTINMSEDHDLFLRLAEVGQVANLPEALLRYRRHYKSVSFTQFHQAWDVKKKIIGDAFQRRGITAPADFEYYHPWSPPKLSVQLRQWGWAAIKAGNIAIARKHAWRAVRAAPLSPDAWRLLFCALRGH